MVEHNASAHMINFVKQNELQPPNLSSTHYINADTGTTGHFIALRDADLLLNVTPTKSGIVVNLPNGDAITSTHTAILNIPTVPSTARDAHVFPQLTGSLLSIGKLTDAGLTATYRSDRVFITNSEGDILLTGRRSPTTQLWMIDMENPNPPISSMPALHAASTVIRNENDWQLVSFYHAALGSPSISTMITAAELGYLHCLPLLSVQKIRRNRPHTIPTAKGHLDQTRQNYKSTKSHFPPAAVASIPLSAAAAPSVDDDSESAFPVTAPVSNTVYTHIEATHQNFMDTTGRFPVQSRSGFEYILVMFNQDLNYIHVEPMRRGKGRLLDAYRRGHQFFKAKGYQPKYERLDNETSKDLEAFMTAEGISFQYVPPGMHRRNKAERAVRTFKNHLISTLCTADQSFPLHLWDTILPQAELTLNLLRGSCLNATLSAWAHMHGPYDYNAHPFVPAGMRIVIHEKPDHRKTWAPHGVDGFYLGPALLHYRCYRAWTIATQRERLVDTVAWYPADVRMPGSSETEILTSAIQELNTLLTAPDLSLPDSTVTRLTDTCDQLAQLFPAIPPRPATAITPLLHDILRASAEVRPSARNTAPSPPGVQTMMPPSPVPDTTGRDQRVSTMPLDASTLQMTSVSTNGDPLPPAGAIPVGRLSLPAGGDNFTFDSLQAPAQRRRVHFEHPTDPRKPTSLHTPTNEAHPTTHIGAWKVLRVVNHQGKISHRSKLRFRVQWHPHAGTVSPDTWIGWAKAKHLHATREYISRIPLMR